MKKYLVEYNSNNSGGDWWLKDNDWKKLEKAGWLVVWASKSFDYNEEGYYKLDKEGLPKLKNEPDDGSTKTKKEYRYLGALAHYAFKRFDDIADALKEFEKITGQDVMEEGCNCCGAPHCFYWESKDDKRGYCSGEGCGEYLYGEKANLSKRELLEQTPPQS